MCSSPFYFNTMESSEKIMRDILESLSKVVNAGQIESEVSHMVVVMYLSYYKYRRKL